MKPQFSPDLVAIIDREHARIRDLLDSTPSMLQYVGKNAHAAMFGRLITIDVLCFAREPERMMYRLAAWDQLCREYGG